MLTGEGTWTCSACGLIFESRQQCLLHMRATHVLPEPKVVFKPPPADLADPETPSRDRAGALYQSDGAWRLQNPNQQRMLVKIKNLDLSTVPYLTEGSRVLLLTGVETRYEPVAEAVSFFGRNGCSPYSFPAGPPVPAPKCRVWVLRQEGARRTPLPCSSYLSCQEPPCGGLSRVAPAGYSRAG